MITTSAAVREVCVVEGGRERERAESEDKVKREKRQAAADRAKKKQNGNDEGDSGGGEEDAIATSSKNRGCGSSSGSDSEKFGSKISRAIAKSIRGKRSSNSKNGSKRNSGGRTLQVQGRG